MRLFEILMLAALLPVLAWPLLPWPRPRWVDFLPGTAVLLMVAQLVLEGYRWQMLPAYALVVVVFVATLPRLRSSAPQEEGRSGRAIAGGVVGLVAWAAAVALPVLLPVPRLPAVTGAYAIGTRTFHLVDESRDEIYTADAGDRREIMVQVWYPAEADAAGEAAVYLDDLDVMGPILAERLGLPTFIFNHVGLVDLDTKKDVPVQVDGTPYPVLVFSHGLRGIRAQNTAMVRELVSQGFVVATIDHTFGNAITVFTDGEVAFYNPDVLSGEGDPAHTSNTLVGVWADDIGFTLDQFTTWNERAGHVFEDQLDLSKVGVFGHSTGGGAAVEFCGSDERCQAGVGLDAWLVPVSEAILETGLTQPFLLLQAENWAFDDAGQNETLAEVLFKGVEDTGYLAAIAGASHYDFTDIPLFSPMTAQLGISSDMDGGYVAKMITSMTSNFFRQEFKDEGDELELKAMSYPEMSLEGNGR